MLPFLTLKRHAPNEPIISNSDKILQVYNASSEEEKHDKNFCSHFPHMLLVPSIITNEPIISTSDDVGT